MSGASAVLDHPRQAVEGDRRATPQAAQWVRQTPTLWVGRLDGRPIGTIERGRRFTFVDVDGVAHRGSPTLAAAQQAHAVTRPSTDRTPSARRAERVLFVASTIAAASTGALAVAAVVTL